MRKLPIYLLAAATFVTTCPPQVSAQSASDRKAFKNRFEAAKSHVDRLMKLALWCEDKNMMDEATRCYRKILRVDPQHDGANRAVGNVRVSGRWVAKDEAEAARKAADMRKDESIAGERKANRAPIVLDLPQEDTDRAVVTGTIKGSRDASKRVVMSWSESSGADETAYHAAISQHVKVMAKVPQEVADQLAQIGEYVYRRLNWITWGKTDANPFPTAGDKRFTHYAVDESDFVSLFDFCVAKHPSFTRQAAGEARKLTAKGSNFVTAAPLPLLLQRSQRNLASGMANTMGAHWFHWNSRQSRFEINLKSGKSQSGRRGRGHVLTWLTEGIGVWASIDAIGTNTTFRFTQSVYKNVGRESKGADADRIAMCYEYATGQLGKKARAKSFYQLSRANLNAMSDLDLAVAWSVVDYLIKERTHEWRELFKRLRKQPTMRMSFVEVFGEKPHLVELKRVLKAKDDRGLEEIYRTVITEFEQQWRAWASKKYEAEYEDPSMRSAGTPPFTPIKVDVPEEDEGDDKKKKKKKKRRRRR